MRLSFAEISAILAVPLQNTEGIDIDTAHVCAVCRDNRDATPEALFVCIVGSRLDGHDFAADAVKKGATALLVSRFLPEISVPQWVVPDTVVALGTLAHAWRQRFTGKVVGITGSSGKTTLKEILADVLHAQGQGYKVARSLLNFNNQIGMPLSMLATTGDEDFWIMEIGISQAQDMDTLGKILEPDIALILNVGTAHTEGLGEKGVAWHKSRILAHIRKNGTALLSADYADLVRESRAVRPDATFFSTKNAAVPYKAAYTGSCTDGYGKYRVWLNGEVLDVSAPFCGSYGAENVVAIAAAAHILGLSKEVLTQGFTTATLPKHRFEMHQVGAWHIIDDSYNANPLSMKRMLEAATYMAGNMPCYAVLGAMGDLGSIVHEEHEKLGRLLAEHKFLQIFWKGPYAFDVCSGLTFAKFTGKFTTVNTTEDLLLALDTTALKPGLILCKGSRSNALEILVQALLQHIHKVTTENKPTETVYENTGRKN